MVFKNGVESIQAAGYNGAGMVCKMKTMDVCKWIQLKGSIVFILHTKRWNYPIYLHIVYLNRGQPLNSAVLYFCQLPSFQIIRALSNFRTYCFSALLNPTWVDLSLHICTQRVEIIFDCFKMLKTITDTVLDWTNHLLSIFHFRYWSRL